MKKMSMNKTLVKTSRLSLLSLCLASAILTMASLTTVFGQNTQFAPHAPLSPLLAGAKPAGNIRHRPASPSGRVHHHALYGKEYQLLQEGKDLYNAGDLRGAESKLLASLAAEPLSDQHPEPEAEQMLGQIYLRQGRYREAIPRLLVSNPYTDDDVRGLDLTIAYARLGDYAQAKRYYNDQILQKIPTAGAPGTGDLRSLEASALLELGISERYYAGQDNSLTYLLAAEHLAPKNVTIAYCTGRALAEKGRNVEAISRFQRVVASPRGSVFPEARQDLIGAKALAVRR